MDTAITSPHKGIFWLTMGLSIDSDGIRRDRASLKLIYMYTDSAPVSHIDAWESLVAHEVPQIKKHKWNYFPRGRGELRKNKCLIFAHPSIIAEENSRALIIAAFGLDNIEKDKLRFIADGSAHYDCAWE